MAQDKRIGLHLPEQSKLGPDSFDTHPRSMEKWVATLPMANLSEMARRVYGALYEVNRLQVSSSERRNFLDSLRPAIHHICQSLKKQFLGLSFPLPPKARKTAALRQALYYETALGYKACIEDIVASSGLFRSNNKLLTELIQRALVYQGRMMLSTYQYYAPLPADTWSDIHLLYAFAEFKDLHKTKVADDENELVPKTRITGVYNQLLLIAACSPYRLRQGEVECVYKALEKWSSDAILKSVSEMDNTVAMFSVRMDSDYEPTPLLFDQTRTINAALRILDTQALTTTLKNETTALQKKTSALKPKLGPYYSESLLQRLLLAWCTPTKRAFKRSNNTQDIQIVIGLSNFHQLLSAEGAQDTTSLTSHQSKFSSKVIHGAANPNTGPDVWDMNYSAAQQSIKSEKRNAAIENSGEKKKNPDVISPQTWQIVNESANGYRLSRQGSETAGIQVGEIIGLRDKNDDAPWETCIIQWIKHSASGIELGTHIMAPEAKPVAIRGLQDKNTQRHYQRALLLPAIATLDQPETLLVASMLFNTGNTILVYDNQDEQTYQLSEMLENTGAYTRFAYMGEKNPSKGIPTSEPQNTDNEPFNDLWSQL